MTDQLDLFVIGGGSGGVACARRAAAHGARVALAEHGRVGGTCVIRGCVPKKLMHHGASVPHELGLARDMGWRFEGVSHDWRGFLEARNREIARLEGIYRTMLDKAGVRLVEGRGRIAGRDGDGFLIDVDGEQFRAHRVLVATGGSPWWPSLPGIEHVVTSDFLLEQVYDLPRRIAIVGAGYIGLEMASIFRGFGCQTSIVLRGDEPLRGFDLELRHALTEQMSASGIDIRTWTVVQAIERTADGLVLRGTDPEITADLVLYATGRKPMPNTRGIGLEAQGVNLDETGSIYVDTSYASNVPGIYAVGDCSDHAGNGLDSGQHDLTPVAIAEGRAIAERLFNRNPRLVNYATIPTAVFSWPEAASCGLSEERARAIGCAVTVFKTSFRPLRTTLGQHADRTMMKLVVDARTDRVLGCHMVGDDAAEIIQGFAAAMTAGATKAQFDDTLAVHPTAAEEFVTMYQPARA